MRMIAVALLLALAGCATAPDAPQTLDERVQDKWDRLVAGDYIAAYEYYSPGYRSVTSLESFLQAMSSRSIPWLGARLRDTGPCEAETCAARVELDYRVIPRVPGAKPFESTRIVHENWIKQNNQWFYVPKQ
ncbi:MAG: hypothetical protein AAGB27_09920 [Pseudomonadota bacterium]